MNVRKSYLNNYNFQKKNGIYQVKIIGTKNWIPVSEDVYKELTHSTWNHEQKMTREEKMAFNAFLWILYTAMALAYSTVYPRILVAVQNPIANTKTFCVAFGKSCILLCQTMNWKSLNFLFWAIIQRKNMLNKSENHGLPWVIRKDGC